MHGSRRFVLRQSAALVVLLVLGLPAAALAQGRKHALLVGVGRYAHMPKASLEGPANDVAALKALLVGQWGFEAKDVRVLLDEAASRAAILAAVDELLTTT